MLVLVCDDYRFESMCASVRFLEVSISLLFHFPNDFLSLIFPQTLSVIAQTTHQLFTGLSTNRIQFGEKNALYHKTAHYHIRQVQR